MNQFSDKHGRSFTCIVTAATAISLRKTLGLDLAGHFDGSLYQKLADDPELLVNTIYLTCKRSITSQNIGETDFAELLDGDVLDAATTALRNAITDFSPPRQRAAMRNLIEKTDQAVNIGLTQLEQKINELTPESILTLLNSSGVKQESSESSQANSTT